MRVKPCTCHAPVAPRYTATAGAHPPAENLLLAALPAAEYQRLLPHLELVEATLGCSMYESGDCMAHVFFPTTAVVALQYVMADGASAETALAGNRGVIGIAAFLGGEFTSGSAVTVVPGHAYRLRTRLLRREFALGGSLQQLLLRYTLALSTQMAQTAMCNRYHSMDQQLCRWLLQCLDYVPSNKIQMTQELIAQMLGVRREGVTESATRLRDAGLILYHRGSITVLDRPGLEQRVCECYAVIKQEADPLRSWKPQADPVQAVRFTCAS